MTVSRIAFAIEDLLREIQGSAGRTNVDVTIMLDGATYDSVIGTIEDHVGHQLPFVFHPGQSNSERRFGGVSITKRDEGP